MLKPEHARLSTARAAWWTVRAARRTKRSLGSEPLEAAAGSLPRVPSLPEGAVRGVHGVLRRRAERCLVRALIVQAWEGAHGRPRDLVIGVTSPRDRFHAHAWLDGAPASETAGFCELVRLPGGNARRD